jgi:diguanylate cyclase (GGDEF)-like protein
VSDYYLALLLGLSVLAQTLAAWIALRQMAEVGGRYRLAWGCVSLALALMVERRLAPLLRLVYSGATASVADAWFGLAISLLMAGGVWGIRRLFIDLNDQAARLDALARTDALTGLPNRREVLERVTAELERAARTGHPTSLLMFDIDRFKRVNDTHGHATGDCVLRAVAAIARASLRRIDVCGRVGGEEFLVLLPEAGAEDACAAAERLRAAIASHATACLDQTLHITVSVGVVTRAPGEATSLDALVQAADLALYAAKDAGRDRVVVA